LKLFRRKEYENFVLEGMRERHNDEYYTVEDQRFLGEEGFGKAISREAGIIVRGRQEINKEQL
jgi:hypothetical protein